MVPMVIRQKKQPGVGAAIAGFSILVVVLLFAAYFFGSSNNAINQPVVQATPKKIQLATTESEELIAQVESTAVLSQRIDPTVKDKFGFSLVLPVDLGVVEIFDTYLVIGSNDVPNKLLTLSKINTIDPAVLPLCDAESNFPCLSQGNAWGQDENIATILVGGRPARSFYITTGTVDSAEHVVQMENTFEARMNIAGGNLDQIFSQILDTITFE